MRAQGFPAMRLLALFALVSLCMLWICSRLVVEPSSCQLERERAFRAEQMVYRLQAQAQPQEANDQALQLRVSQLEQSLSEERSKNSGAGGFQGALVSSLQGENQVLQSKVAELNAQIQRLSQQPQQPQQNSLLRQGRSSDYDRPPDANYYVGQGGQMSSNADVITEERLREFASKGATAVAVVTCKRPKYLERAMESFVTQRGMAQADQFPFIISQDAFDAGMTQLVQDKYVNQGLAYHMHHEHDANAPQIARRFGKNAIGYVRIAQHYGFIMQKIFDDFGFNQVIFLEEDMEVSPDFFSYFGSMLPILKADPMLYCVSAWNDNGNSNLAQDSRAVFRTEFFPGLGWMTDKRFWAEVRDRWAVAFWDEFMRRPDVRRGRHCIRPEISRSFTFGEQGVSAGQFFKSHLSKIRLNDEAVDWAAQDLSYLASPEAFETHLSQELRQAPQVDFYQVDRNLQPGAAMRIEYDDKRDYKKIAGKFGLMPDEKEGIRRGAYRGVIPFSWSGSRVYLYTGNWPADIH